MKYCLAGFLLEVGKSLPFWSFDESLYTKDGIWVALASGLVLVEYIIGCIFSFDYCDFDPEKHISMSAE
jgi:hypothetical protein